MIDLADFLLARIAEDEAVAREIVTASDADYSADWTLPASATVDVGDDDVSVGDQRLARHIARHDPARVLAECKAKRRIVESRAAISLPSKAIHYEVQHQREYVWKLLTLPYADHPDYREEWRP